MDLNFIVFPAPKCSYSEDIVNGQLIWIPKYEEKENVQIRGSNRNNTAVYRNNDNADIQSEFSATKNKNFGSHTKPINYRNKRLKQTNYNVNNSNMDSFNFDDTFFNNDEASHRLFYSLSSNRQCMSYQPTNANIDSIQQPSQKISKKSFLEQVENQKIDKDYIQILQQGRVQNVSGKKNVQVNEESNKSTHDLNSCELMMKVDESEEEAMERDCNEYDEMHSNISCNVKPDSITQYSFSKNQQQSVLQQNQKQNDSSSSLNSNTILQQKNDSNLNKTKINPIPLALKKAQTMGSGSRTACNSPVSQFAEQRNTASKYIPCLYLNSGNHSPNYLLYFHGNGEDINLSYDLLSHMKNNLEVNVIAMEYPGYGIYDDFDTSAEKSALILKDTECVYDYLTNVLHIDEKKIIIFGRSIGSGPATHIAAHRNPGALVLMSAFTSLRQVASDLVGSILSYALKERFNNLENIKNVTCPTFLVHGQIDKLISYNHSMSLFQNCGGICQINLPKEMTHVEFDFYEDFSKPLIEFLLKNKFNLYNYSPQYSFNFPRFLMINPKNKMKIPDEQEASQSMDNFNQFQPMRVYMAPLRQSVQ